MYSEKGQKMWLFLKFYEIRHFDYII